MHVQMARELGLNPNKLGKLANHRQEPWKAPLPDFITRCYVKRFGKVPDVVRMIEEVAAAEMAKRQARKMRKHGSPSGSAPIDNPMLGPKSPVPAERRGPEGETEAVRGVDDARLAQMR
jgi:hypothetical protein